jgi:predicted kinase
MGVFRTEAVPVAAACTATIVVTDEVRQRLWAQGFWDTKDFLKITSFL